MLYNALLILTSLSRLLTQLLPVLTNSRPARSDDLLHRAFIYISSNAKHRLKHNFWDIANIGNFGYVVLLAEHYSKQSKNTCLQFYLFFSHTDPPIIYVAPVLSKCHVGCGLGEPTESGVPREWALLGIRYLTPLAQWTHLVFASTEHNKFCTGGEMMRPRARITVATC